MVFAFLQQILVAPEPLLLVANPAEGMETDKQSVPSRTFWAHIHPQAIEMLLLLLGAPLSPLCMGAPHPEQLLGLETPVSFTLDFGHQSTLQ